MSKGREPPTVDAREGSGMNLGIEKRRQDDPPYTEPSGGFVVRGLWGYPA